MDMIAATGSLPTWQFSPQWQVLPGMAFGTRQAAMLGCCDVCMGPWDGGLLDRAMAEHFPEETVTGDAPGDGPDIALVRRLLFWSGALQRHFKVPVFGAANIWRDPDPALPQRLQIALPYASADASRIALQWVSQAAQRLMRGQPLLAADLDAVARALQPFQARGYNTIRFLQAAQALDMPWRGVVPGVIAYGQGYASRWLESSYTDRTPVLGTRLARDKFRTAQVLRQFGLPAPTHARAASPQHAVQLARQIGYPVVVKPADRDQGQGVSADLQDDAAVLTAFAVAARCSEHILVEKHADGKDYRLTVLNGRLIKTVVRRAAGVVGDGRHTIAELVEQLRNDPVHRHARELHGRAAPELDAEALALLAQHALAPQTVPDRGRFVALRRRANVTAGGTPELVVGGVHPDNQRLAERAAQALQLDLAGVDLIMPDIGRSWLKTGALICEVNGQPQLGSSTTPGIYRQVLRELVPTPWRLPVVLVIDAGAQLALRLHALLPAVPAAPTAEGAEWRSPGISTRREHPWGVACADGVWEGPEQIAAGTGSGFAAARVLAASRSVGGAIVAMTPDQVMRGGLPFDRLCMLVVAAGANGDSGSSGLLPQAVWHMVLPHVEGAIVCAHRHLHNLPADRLQQPERPVYPFEGSDAELVSAVLPLLLDRLGSPVSCSGDSPT